MTQFVEPWPPGYVWRGNGQGDSGVQGGLSAAVATDASVVGTVTFNPPYVSVVNAVSLTVTSGASDDGLALNAKVFNVTLTGFQFTIGGGTSVVTAAAYWTAVGI